MHGTKIMLYLCAIKVDNNKTTKTKNKITKKINIMKNTINQTKNNEVVNANVSGGGYKPIFASADLWNIHKMVKGRVYRRYF